MAKILVVEDEPIIRHSLKRLLERNHYEVQEAGSVAEAEAQPLEHIDLIITDLRLPGAPGTELIKYAKKIPVLVMTSYASLKSAVDAMKQGAADYIAKPFDHQEMLGAVKHLLQQLPATSIVSATPSKSIPLSSSETLLGFSPLIGTCPAMKALYQRILKVAPTNTTVLILGESGTGKELVAKALHQQSLRAQGPLISVNCAAIPENLVESELFGHEKGAFTGANNLRKGLVEAADGGTLFLDEIGELPLEAQARLLRLLQEKEVRRVGSVQSRKVDVRLAAATHRDLKRLAAQGGFREDLYYRLHVVELQLPPLRERGGEDILALANHFLKQSCERLHRAPLTLDTNALSAIQHYHWPGNVRELQNAIERAAVLCDGPVITEEEMNLDKFIPEPVSAYTTQPVELIEAPVENLSLEDYFQHFVLEHQEHMTETELSQKLGISRKSLWERRQRLGIPRNKKVLPNSESSL